MKYLKAWEMLGYRVKYYKCCICGCNLNFAYADMVLKDFIDMENWLNGKDVVCGGF